jgi:K+-sensing histidine kinase KdpD
LVERYDPQGLLAADDWRREEMVLAVRKGETVLGQDKSATMLATPIKARGQTIGVLNAHKPAGTGAWTPEEVALLETLTEQLSVALESARLYQDTQRRAAREQVVGQVATQMRETLNVDAVLQTAVREMRQALDIAEVEVRLDTAQFSKGE